MNNPAVWRCGAAAAWVRHGCGTAAARLRRGRVGLGLPHVPFKWSQCLRKVMKRNIISAAAAPQTNVSKVRERHTHPQHIPISTSHRTAPHPPSFPPAMTSPVLHHPCLGGPPMAEMSSLVETHWKSLFLHFTGSQGR